MKLPFLRHILEDSDINQDAPYPDVYSAYYPRHYSEPLGWFSPKAYAYVYGAISDRADEISNDEHNTIWELVCAALLAQNRVPTWWVGAELFEALCNTRPPANMKLADIKWAMPACLFMLPIEQSRKVFGRNVPWIAGSTTRSNHEVQLPIGKDGYGRKFTLAKKQPDTLYSMVVKASMWFRSGEDRKLWKYPNVNFDGTISMHMPITPELTVKDIVTKQWPEGFEYERGAPVGDGDQDRLDLCVSVFVQLLLLLSMAKEKMETMSDVLIPALVKGKGETKQILEPTLFSPRWVGKHYKMPRREPQGGTHASPIVHPRCGHWRDQPIGEGRKETKQIWIEPTIVGAK